MGINCIALALYMLESMVDWCAVCALERMAFSMSQMPNFKLSHHSLKRLLFGGLSGGIGVAGVLFAVSLYIVESLIRPKKYKNRIETYKFSPFELGLPAEEV